MVGFFLFVIVRLIFITLKVVEGYFLPIHVYILNFKSAPVELCIPYFLLRSDCSNFLAIS